MSEKMTTANSAEQGKWILTLQSAQFRSGADADL